MSSIAPIPPASNTLDAKRDSSAALIILILFGLLGALYWPTWQSMIQVWNTPTYSHSYVIPIASLWLIYEKRAELARLQSWPWWSVLPVLLAAGMLWLLGHLAGVNTITHLAVVASVALVVAFTVGKKRARVIRFPLAFLLLAVPFGDFLVPYMMDWTANVTIWMVQASGVPIYREGLSFILPSGAWQVVEECSGQRYLIALLPLALVFGQLTFKKTRTKVLFVVTSLAVAVVANWIRAYLIVMTGHLSNMQLATGVDHLIYGWFFFGIIATLLFIWGSRWKEDHNQAGHTHVDNATSEQAARLSPNNAYPFVSALLAGVVALAAGNAAAHLLSGQQSALVSLSGQIRPIIIDESIDESLALALPYEGAADQIHGRIGEGDVNLWVGHYLNDQPSSEMIRGRHSVVNANRKALRHTKTETVAIADQGTASAFSFVGQKNDVLVWQMYFVNGRVLSDERQAKIQLTLQRLRGSGAGTSVAVLWTGYQSDPAVASQRLSLAAQALIRQLTPNGPDR